jgi:hypothetical protein
LNILFLFVILLLAFLVESLTEYLFGTPFDKIPKLTPYKWTLMYVAMLIGIGGAFVYHLDLVSILGGYIGLDISPGPFGMILTGAAIGRGSNFVHDIITKFFVKTEPEQPA